MRWQPQMLFVLLFLTLLVLTYQYRLMQPGYTLRQTAFTDTTMTSTLSRVAEEGVTVSCEAITPTLTTIGSTTIHLAGELSLHVYFTLYLLNRHRFHKLAEPAGLCARALSLGMNFRFGLGVGIK